MILDFCCCGHGEFVMQVLEWVGIIDDQWEKRREEREMEPYLVGLSNSEREIVIGEVKRNRLRLEEATKLRWEEMCKHAIRPNDPYHNGLLSRVIHEEKEEHTNDVKPGTPRRRRRIEV